MKKAAAFKESIIAKQQDRSRTSAYSKKADLDEMGGVLGLYKKKYISSTAVLHLLVPPSKVTLFNRQEGLVA